MLQIVWRNPEAPKRDRVALSRIIGDRSTWTAYFRLGAFTSSTTFSLIRGGLYGAWRPKCRRAS